MTARTVANLEAQYSLLCPEISVKKDLRISELSKTGQRHPHLPAQRIDGDVVVHSLAAPAATRGSSLWNPLMSREWCSGILRS